VNLRHLRAARWLMAFALLITLVTVVGSATAAPNTDLFDPDVRLSDGFYPCPAQAEFNRAPFVNECLDGSYQPLVPPGFPVVDLGQTSCDPNNLSTIRVQRTTGFASTPSVVGPGWLDGSTVSWDLTATIEPQTDPAKPNFQPFPDDGMRMDSVGLPTGGLASVDGTFTIDPPGAGPNIVAEVDVSPNDGNWGVCRTFYEEDTGSPVFGPAPITGSFYIVNAAVLTYEVISGPAGMLPEAGVVAEAYFSNTLATCCDAEAPTNISAATGHLKLQFGTTHPGTGTGGSAETVPNGSNPVTVSNFVGLNEDVGGVAVTFPTVTSPGTTTVTALSELPAPADGQFQVGDPPAIYEIDTDAGYTSPIRVCLPYGSLPAGIEPKVFHYNVGTGLWDDVTVIDAMSPSGPPNYSICGLVSSLSPFAVGYTQIYDVSGPFQPIDPQETVNTMKAGRTVPVKFTLGGDYGLDVFAEGYPVSQSIDCDSDDPIDPVETTSSTSSGLTYDAVTGTYQYNWKTSSDWKGQCRTLILQFTDGQELRADFKFN
jgi:hypothetical protein